MRDVSQYLQYRTCAKLALLARAGCGGRRRSHGNGLVKAFSVVRAVTPNAPQTIRFFPSAKNILSGGSGQEKNHARADKGTDLGCEIKV